jgi:hypothetical protein
VPVKLGDTLGVSVDGADTLAELHAVGRDGRGHSHAVGDSVDER